MFNVLNCFSIKRCNNTFLLECFRADNIHNLPGNFWFVPKDFNLNIQLHLSFNKLNHLEERGDRFSFKFLSKPGAGIQLF